MKRRGQATVELALGSLLLLTTVMLGLWLSEASFLSLKVQEASAAAVWNATGRPVDDFTNPTGTSASASNYSQLLADVPQAVGDQYKDFDGYGNKGSGITLLFAAGQRLQVKCQGTPSGGPTSMAFDVPASTSWFDGKGVVPAPVNNQLRGWFTPRGATMCNATAQISSVHLPATFSDKTQGGFFTAFRDSTRVFRFCGAGKAVGQACSAAYPVLLGDWGFDGTGQIVKDAPLAESVGFNPAQDNAPYRGMVQALFANSGQWYDADKAGWGASGRFATELADRPTPPGFWTGHRDRKFYMSYSGSEHGYGDMLKWKPNEDRKCIQCHFNTAGTQPVNGNPILPNSHDDWRDRRQACFLGLGGCKP